MLGTSPRVERTTSDVIKTPKGFGVSWTSHLCPGRPTVVFTRGHGRGRDVLRGADDVSTQGHDNLPRRQDRGPGPHGGTNPSRSDVCLTQYYSGNPARSGSHRSQESFPP